MTSRLFLTLLAFLTGFAVQGASAEARVLCASSAEVGAVAAHSAAGQASVCAAVSGLAADPGKPAKAASRLDPVPSPARNAPAVYIRIDRARE